MAKAIKFYDKNNTGFEFFINSDGNITLKIEDDDPYHSTIIEIDEEDIDDIIIAMTDLKKEHKEFWQRKE